MSEICLLCVLFLTSIMCWSSNELEATHHWSLPSSHHHKITHHCRRRGDLILPFDVGFHKHQFVNLTSTFSLLSNFASHSVYLNIHGIDVKNNSLWLWVRSLYNYYIATAMCYRWPITFVFDQRRWLMIKYLQINDINSIGGSFNSMLFLKC